jgi:adenosylmethionine-8-amino-7-oxononanoate aminotransferase
VTGDTLALSPPLIITSEQITELVDGIGSILAEIA